MEYVTWNKNDLSKQVVPITYTLEKRFFAVAILLKVCELFLVRQAKKTCGLFFGPPEKRRPNKYCLWEVYSFFYI